MSHPNHAEEPAVDSVVTETSGAEPGVSSESASVADIEKALAEAAQWREQFLRLRAEFDNFRKRQERERVEILEYAGLETAKALLPALDDFDRAIQMAPSQSGDEALAQMRKGMELIHSRLLGTLKKAGLEPIDPLGQAFDPHQHEAIDRVESYENEDQTVMQVFQKGYQFKTRLVRPAMVKVSYKP